MDKDAYHPFRQQHVWQLTLLPLVSVVCMQPTFPSYVADPKMQQIVVFCKVVSTLFGETAFETYCVVFPDPVSPTMTMIWCALNCCKTLAQGV
jgi:hypothetical protein